MNFRNSVAITGVLLVAFSVAVGQKARPRPAAKQRPVVFAVLNDGKVIEPIAFVEKGKLTQAIDNASEAAQLSAFHRTYYKASAGYQLFFGGSNAGSVKISSSDPSAECTANTANVTFTSTRAKLRGNVMALASNIIPTSKASGVRRLPTPAERSEIEALVKAEMLRNKIGPAAASALKYHNLTAVDVDSDGSIEFVGTFWVDPTVKSRALLFFIAEKGTGGKYSFGATDFRVIKEEEVMSGEIAALDSGVYHERLLDLLDVDNDGIAEVFTYIQSFEGAGFNVYSRKAGKWSKIFEGTNYHCGY